jgi:phospholipid transport system transporter-binding protein
VAAVIDPVSEGVYRVKGDLVFATAPGVLEAARRLFQGGSGELVFDLSEVARTDSAGLAVLLEWLDAGRASGVGVSFRNLPAALLDIARLSNAEALLEPGRR